MKPTEKTEAPAHQAFHCVLYGEGPLLVQCAKILLDRRHRVLGVVTADEAVRRWARNEAIETFESDADLPALLGRLAFDYLWSINNRTVVASSLLRLARHGGINLHDGPLPRDAGFHATSWALIRREKTHGVTWHQMTDVVDSGDILAEKAVVLAGRETAQSLGVLCFQAALDSFADLLRGLEAGRAPARPQDLARRTIHARTEPPPDGGVVCWERSAVEIDGLVRALDFGPQPNDFGVPRLAVGRAFVLVTEAEPAAPITSEPAGTVTGISSSALSVATASGEIALRRFQTLGGQALSPSELVHGYGLVVGSRLPELDSNGRERVAAGCREAARSEAFWVERLAGLRAYKLPFRRRPRSEEQGSPQAVVLPEISEAVVRWVGRVPGWSREEFVLAVFVAYLARLADQPDFDIGWRVFPTAEADPETRLFAAVVPLRVEVDLGADITAGREGLRRRLDAVAKHGTYLRDAVARYPALRARYSSEDPEGFEVAVRRYAPDPPEIPSSAAVTLDLGMTACRLFYDNERVDGDTARGIARQFTTFMRALVADPSRPIAELPLLDDAERSRILALGNLGRVKLGPPRCIHDLVSAVSARNPDAVAVISGNRSITYRELDRRASQLASHLRILGVGPDRLVGICVRRSVEMVVGMLGVLKAGGAYVPLDPEYPPDRLAAMLEEAQPEVVLTEEALASRLPATAARQIRLDADLSDMEGEPTEPSGMEVSPENLAYVIFTSGSSGRPKGVMVRHRNVASLFDAMDEHIGRDGPGVWLALTSISFDISVLELLWTLSRGFRVILHPSQEAILPPAPEAGRGSQRVGFSLFYFSSDAGETRTDRYRLLLDGARFADEHGFEAVWTPERHFHSFGGLFPNPSVTGAALATLTRRVKIRAGSVVLPLHDPIRVAEEWSVVDNLSRGRIGIAFASGWHATDFALAPQNYVRRKELTFRGVETIRNLWSGKAVAARSGTGQEIEVRLWPAPVQGTLPFWITSAGNEETFRQAGEVGGGVLTNLIGQDLEELGRKIDVYRAAWRRGGHPGKGTVTLMVHTFVGESVEAVRETVRVPFSRYLASSFDLIQMAPWAFPAFRQPSRRTVDNHSFDPATFTPEDRVALIDHAFERYFETGGLFGTPDSCLPTVRRFAEIGVDEVACLIDFGVETETVLGNLPRLDELRRASGQMPGHRRDESVAAQIRRHGVTHVQCTPSLARILASDPESLAALGTLRVLLLGGEALPEDLAATLRRAASGDILNVYGPTETTIWSTAAAVTADGPVTIGRPLANTEVYLVDRRRQLVPLGVPGEIWLGGAGVARGYLNRPEPTAERFVPHPFSGDPQARVYRTGDIGRLRPDGQIDCLGRNDDQVKIRGHRVELGEIESTLLKHPDVRESVVVARSEDDNVRILAYVVPRRHLAPVNGRTENVAAWRAVWDETYRAIPEPQAPPLSIERAPLLLAGWRDSETGRPFEPEEMEEWAEVTAARILALRPQRLLEIGCGLGLLLFRVAPSCARYDATDFSQVGLQRLRDEIARRGSALSHVTLWRREADDFRGLPGASYDGVVLNSVVQYFPDEEYLRRVLEGAVRAIDGRGVVFIGDVRNLRLLEEFHSLRQLARVPASLSRDGLWEHVREAVRREEELVLDPAFFQGLPATLPEIGSVHVLVKRGRRRNEMTRFRYDVVLRVGEEANRACEPERELDWADIRKLDRLRELLCEKSPVSLTVRGIPDKRVRDAVTITEWLGTGSGPGTVAALREALARAPTDGAIDPEDLWKVGEAAGLDVEITPAESPQRGAVDVSFWPSMAVVRPRPRRDPSGHAGAQGASGHGKRPLRDAGAVEADLEAELRAFLEARLPSPMVPSRIVVLDALPRTPNGKVDRRALPAAEEFPARSDPDGVAPSGHVEEGVAAIWREVLELENISRGENFFDLGGHSLLATQVVSRLRDLFRCEVPLRAIFDSPTIEGLAREILERKPKPEVREDVVPLIPSVLASRDAGVGPSLPASEADAS